MEAKLGYGFDQPENLKRLIEESKVPGTKQKRPPFHKQAETLGDAILGAYVTTELLRRVKGITSESLHEKRKLVVGNAPLSKIAKRLGLQVTVDSPFVRPGSRRATEEVDEMLGGTVEALIGGAYMDGGLKAAHTVLGQLTRESLEEVAPTRPEWVRNLRPSKETHVDGD